VGITITLTQKQIVIRLFVFLLMLWLIPSFSSRAVAVGRPWPTRSKSNIEGIEGFIHVFGLAYDLAAPNFWAAGKGQTFRFSGDITYNDSFGSGAAEHDWSHAVFGTSTNFGNGNLTITPYV
jgi:hypothetical protein